VSSILDALKKLERDKDENEPDFTWPQHVNTRLTLSEQLRKKYGHRLWIGLGGGIFLVVSVVFLLAGSGEKKNPDQAALSPADKKAVAVSEDAVPGTETVEDAMAFDETVQRPPTIAKDPEDEEALPEEAMVVDKESQSGLDALAALVSGKKTGILSKNGSDTKGSAIPSSKVEQTAEFDRKASELIKRIPKSILPPQRTVESSWLTLHAISWSSNPLNRIAVINSQIVKEGRRVEGGLVKRIDKDYVVIEKDGEDLMLPFNNH
jgi:hypothetical protein